MFERIELVFRAMLNALLGKVEDPQMMLEQTYAELVSGVSSTRQKLSQSLALERELEKKLKELVEKEGSDSPAVAEAKEQLERQRENTRKIRAKLAEFENQVQKAYTRKQVLIARDKAARATSKANEILSQSTPEGAAKIIERMNVSLDGRLTELEEELIWARKELARAVAFELELGDSLEMMKQIEKPDSPRISSLKEKLDLQREEVAEIRLKVKMLEELSDGTFAEWQARQLAIAELGEGAAEGELNFVVVGSLGCLFLIVLFAIWKIYH